MVWGANFAVRRSAFERLGPFECEFFAVNHSIPDALAVAIRTPAGLVLHTGDIKLDQLPLDGRLTDLGGKTEMVFHQTGLDTRERSDVQQGWSSCLDRLAGHVGRGTLPPVVPAAVWEPAWVWVRVPGWARLSLASRSSCFFCTPGGAVLLRTFSTSFLSCG